jgi:3-isopropylmalate/(R)-2-methylmalate dehydratase large subunit
LGRTITQKIWERHLLAEREDSTSLIYIDRHYTHEVTSPVAFESLREEGRKLRRPDLTFGFVDHNVPTGDRTKQIENPLSRMQIELIRKNASEFGFTLFDYLSEMQGIVHVSAPELGLTLPGLTVACGDSHTSTHGALGALSFGIGTSEGEHLFATQCLWLKKPKEMRVRVNGIFQKNVSSKDVALFMIGKVGAGGAIGHIVEFEGEAISRMEVEQRMTLTNMAIEAGARTAIISPDEKVFSYLEGREYAPKDEEWDEALSYWEKLPSDSDVHYDAELIIDVSRIEPQVTWGTNPSMVSGITGYVPDPREYSNENERKTVERALKYMGLEPGTKITDIKVDRVFIGSCTNGRITDLIEAAKAVAGKKVAQNVRAMVVPGSMAVKRQAEALGLHRIFIQAGFEWRNSGCSMCIAMNGDSLSAGERCASTSNRNFENRQGFGGRTHLVSPLMAAMAAVEGHFVDVREYDFPTDEEIIIGR